MGMDLLRSCYTASMRFFSDSDMTIPIRWFFCDPGAQVFPTHHRFCSSNWDSDRFGREGPGEVMPHPFQYNKGRGVGFFQGHDLIWGNLGTHFCGPLEGFQEGVAFPGVPLGVNAFEHLQCCMQFPEFLWLRIIAVTNPGPGQFGAPGDHFRLTWNGDMEAPVWNASFFFFVRGTCGPLRIAFGAQAGGFAASCNFGGGGNFPDHWTRTPLFFHYPVVEPTGFVVCGLPGDETWEATVSDVPAPDPPPSPVDPYFPPDWVVDGYFNGTFP
jgi:hypothetical protein